MSKYEPTEFDDLLDALCEGGLTQSEVDRLETLAASDPAARARLVERLQLDAILRWESTESRPASASPLKPGDARVPGRAPVSASGAPIYRKGHEPKPSRFRPHHYALAAAAALLIASGLGVYVFVSSLPQSEPPDPASNQPLANLIENASGGTLTTPGGFISEGRDYPAGEYTLSGGTAEFMLTNAVNVKLRGETRLVMYNEMNVDLARGSAEFVCPKDAAGFTVRLPDGVDVVDLGTAFVVDVDDLGRTRLRVTEGRVEVRGLENTPSLTLDAGAAVRIAQRRAEPYASLVELTLEEWTNDSPTDHRGQAHLATEFKATSHRDPNLADVVARPIHAAGRRFIVGGGGSRTGELNWNYWDGDGTNYFSIALTPESGHAIVPDALELSIARNGPMAPVNVRVWVLPGSFDGSRRLDPADAIAQVTLDQPRDIQFGGIDGTNLKHLDLSVSAHHRGPVTLVIGGDGGDGGNLRINAIGVYGRVVPIESKPSQTTESETADR